MSIRRCLVLSIILLASPGLAVAQAVAQGAAGAPQVTAALLPHDLSFWGMIENADWVVKSVIAGLAVASVLTWTVALAKMVEFVLLGRAAGAGLATLRAAGSLDEAVTRIGARGTCAQLARVAQREVQASTGLPADGVKERTAWALERVAAGAGRAMGRGTGILATIGSVAPFVGLFGTVWGIMNAFIGIARSQTTNLAVVAPGIAEALLATAVGLVAAIPAVVIYNVFARATAGARARLADGVAETMRVLSRELDRAEVRGAGHEASPLPRLRIAE